LSLLEPQSKPQSSTAGHAGPPRRINGRFAKGYSGNPAGHRTFAANQAAVKAHAATLLKALLDELYGKVSAVDLAFAEQAAAMLARAAISDKKRVWLTNNAQSIIERLRERYPVPAAKRGRLPTLKELGL
jgi:hypothetical protein